MPWHRYESLNQPPSRLLTETTVGDFYAADPLARAAVDGELTEADFIRILLKDRNELLQIAKDAVHLNCPTVVMANDPSTL